MQYIVLAHCPSRYYPLRSREFILCCNFSLGMQRLLFLTDVQTVDNASSSFRFQPYISFNNQNQSFIITIPSALTTIDCNQQAIHPYLRIQLSLFMSINNWTSSKDTVYSHHFCSQTLWKCALAASKRAAPVHHSVCPIDSACIGSIKYWIPIALT